MSALDAPQFSVKFPTRAGVGLTPQGVIPSFHRWIQHESLDELLIDVTSYAHVKRGPGVLLIAHEAHYSFEETDGEVGQLMDDLRSADVDFMTIGQYLQPTPKHAVVDRFVEPSSFAQFARIGAGKGFLLMSSTPLTRSSYHADADFAALQMARNAAYSGA